MRVMSLVYSYMSFKDSVRTSLETNYVYATKPNRLMLFGETLARYGLNFSAHRVYLCVPYGSHNKQRLFPKTALTGWALLWRRCVFPVRSELDFYILCRWTYSVSRLNCSRLGTALNIFNWKRSVSAKNHSVGSNHVDRLSATLYVGWREREEIH
jgi:hypothetical protein